MSKSRKTYFWFSQKHLEHYRWTNSVYAQYPDNDLFSPCLDLAVKINGAEVPYTACRGEEAKEPYDGAMNNFPDYQLIGVATMDDIVSRGVLK